MLVYLSSDRRARKLTSTGGVGGRCLLPGGSGPGLTWCWCTGVVIGGRENLSFLPAGIHVY